MRRQVIRNPLGRDGDQSTAGSRGVVYLGVICAREVCNWEIAEMSLSAKKEEIIRSRSGWEGSRDTGFFRGGQRGDRDESTAMGSAKGGSDDREGGKLEPG